MKAKSGALDRFKPYHVVAERHSDCKVEIVRSGNGGEYKLNAFKMYFAENNIKHDAYQVVEWSEADYWTPAYSQ